VCLSMCSSVNLSDLWSLSLVEFYSGEAMPRYYAPKSLYHRLQGSRSGVLYTLAQYNKDGVW
jgi:hypothetical protein